MLAEQVCKTGEVVQLRDMFGFQRIKERRLHARARSTSSWSDDMEKDFSKWLNDHIDKPARRRREQIQELLKARTW